MEQLMCITEYTAEIPITKPTQRKRLEPNK